MGWLEFTIIIGCGLFGYIVVNSVIEALRSRAERQNQNRQEHTASDEHEFRTEAAQPPRREPLNIDKSASPEKIKTAFRREIAKYHPDRRAGHRAARTGGTKGEGTQS